MSEIKIPERHNYEKITPFRLFVKSNFPFIENTYESLDNYGLYCKVVEYLNQVIAEQNDVSADMITFTDFVTNYFKNLDVSEEINNKLDEMAETGVLQELLNGQYEELKTEVNETIANNNTQQNQKINQNATNINVLSGRMDTFTHLAQGSTTGDAELKDIRTMFNGTVAGSAGSAVRAADQLLFDKFKNYVASNNNGIFEIASLVEPYDDLNTFPVNEIGVYGQTVQSALLNKPTKMNNGFTIMSFNSSPNSQSSCVQFAIDFNGKYFAYRINISDTWTNWAYTEDLSTAITSINNTLNKMTNDFNFLHYMLNYKNELPGTTLTDNSIIDYSNGQVISSQYTNGYQVTDFIPIKYLDFISLAYVRGSNLCGGALYDENKNFIRTIWGTDDWTQPSTDTKSQFNFINTFENAKYLRYNVVIDQFYPKANNYVYVADNILSKSKLNEQQIFYVGASRNGTNTFKTLKECTEYILNNDIFNSKVYVDNGVYDLVEEFTQEYLDSIEQTQNKYIGLLLGNNTHFIFNENALVKFLYDGTNQRAAEFFSPFNIYGSCTIENANIECTNARYCVHEDVGVYAGTKPNQMYVKYLNCNMVHNGATVSTGEHSGYCCIGGGCYKNTISIIDGGSYKGAWVDGDISYHNYDGTEASRVVIKNAWLYRKIRLATFSTSIVNCEISGNRYIADPVYNSTYFNVKKWNNIIETN